MCFTAAEPQYPFNIPLPLKYSRVPRKDRKPGAVGQTSPPTRPVNWSFDTNSASRRAGSFQEPKLSKATKFLYTIYGSLASHGERSRTRQDVDGGHNPGP